MLEYITADKRELIQSVLNTADHYSDTNIKAALRMMPIVSEFAKFVNQDDMLPDIEAEIGDAKKKGDVCEVEIIAAAESVNVKSVSFLVSLKLDPQDQVWLNDSAQLGDV